MYRQTQKGNENRQDDELNIAKKNQIEKKKWVSCWIINNSFIFRYFKLQIIDNITTKRIAENITTNWTDL